MALALQVFYPDFFNGAWSFCPDSVDFRSFQLVDIYHDDNAYINEHGFERPGARDTSGDVRYTMRHECQVENVLGRGDSWVISGGQWGAWNATYGARGPDGRPVPLWDPATGAIDHKAAEHWKSYDLRRVLEANWNRSAPSSGASFTSGSARPTTISSTTPSTGSTTSSPAPSRLTKARSPTAAGRGTAGSGSREPT